MRNLLKFLGILTISLTMQGCSWLADLKIPGVYKIDIPQGNIIDQEQVDQLKPGMTERQVRFLMGTPLLVDTFNTNRWDYYYSLKDGKTGEFSEQHMALFFEEGRLVSISGDYRPVSAEEAGAIAIEAKEGENEEVIIETGE